MSARYPRRVAVQGGGWGGGAGRGGGRPAAETTQSRPEIARPAAARAGGHLLWPRAISRFVGMARKPFRFEFALSLTRYTGYAADNLRALLRGLERVPGGSIYHHLHHALFRRHFAIGAFANDFAVWCWKELHEEALGERLTIIDPLEFSTIRAARNRLIEEVDRYLGSVEYVQHVPHERQFFFQESQTFVLPTGKEAYELPEFAAEVRKASPDVIFHHFVVAALRVGPGENDFSVWIEEQCRKPDLAQRLRELSPYSVDLFTLQNRIADLVLLHA